ncbi:SMI1/KNR4 family protein [Oleiharenicola lentus]|uniref:SMI1/KNR4 family protein n=1 Tax=Oleiharenicola lentus TaxID=2508720 RepID=UPI003F660F25
MKFPQEFIDYLRSDAPRFGDLPSFPVYFQLWEEPELELFNADYEVSKYAPGFLGFGSDGGGEMFAFDEKGRIFALPFIGMSPKDATFVCESWAEFVSRIVVS